MKINYYQKLLFSDLVLHQLHLLQQLCMIVVCLFFAFSKELTGTARRVCIFNISNVCVCLIMEK